MTTQTTDSALHVAARWPRQHWLDLADDLLAATTRHATPGHALLHLPGPVSASGRWSDGLEGFARTFLLAAFRVRGEQGADPGDLLSRYADGLRHGTDPSSSERWPRMTERRQAVVEAASIAVALSETRPWLWHRLDPSTQQRVVTWLADIVGTSGYRNNWSWFQTVVETFLAEVGGPWDQADLDRNDELQESLYVGDGWYSDGRGRDGGLQSFDWYAGWAWHLYPLLRARIAGRALEERHAERLHAYLDQAQHLVGSTGAPLLQGRSITYRLGMLAPFWAGALADATPLTPGATRTLTACVAEHFISNGAVSEDGLLSVGWHERHERVRQLYTGGASPYWASKGFLGLLLPADHAVWADEPEHLAHWQRDAVTALQSPGWLVSSTAADGIVRVLNHGSDRLLDHPAEPRADDPFYRRVGYANVTSPQLSPGAITTPVESHVALLDAAGRPSHRDGIVRVRLDDHIAVSRSRVHWLDLPGAITDPSAESGCTSGDAGTWASLRRGPVVTTASVVHGPHEVRVAWWTVPPAVPDGRPGDDLDADVAWPPDPGPWRLRIGGWPLAAPSDAGLPVEEGDGWVRVARSDGTTSTVCGLSVHGADHPGHADHPWSPGSPGLTIAGTLRRTRSDPLGHASATPWVASDSTLAEAEPCAALVTLSGERPVAHGDPVTVVDVVRADGRAGPSLEVRWHDGHVDVLALTEVAR